MLSNVTSHNGGGIYCTHGAELRLHSESAVSGNQAVSGGGIFVNGCSGYINSGATGLLGLFRNIGSNSATFGGGGLYVSSSAGPSDIVIGEGLGADDPRPTFALNSADVQGGGIFVVDEGTRLTLRNARIISNTSGSIGGGIQVRNGPEVTIERTLQRCGGSTSCSDIVDNEANYGGGIALAGEGTNVVVRGTRIGENSAIRGSAVFNQQGNSRILLENVLIDDNSGPTVISASETFSSPPLRTLTQIVGSTIADNNAPDSVLQSNAEGELLVSLSIVREAPSTEVFAFDGGNDPVAECSMFHEIASLPAPMPGVVANDSPGFVDAAGGDYHLPRVSNGVDRCAAQSHYPTTDFDLQPRPYDVPDFANLAGPWDVGAFEANDRVFVDGFEGT